MLAIFFVVALLLAFSTGTLWGAFAILLPITVSIFGDQMVTADGHDNGYCFGEIDLWKPLSPISNTTILGSTGVGYS